MSAQIYIHPAVGLEAMSDLCERAGIRIDSVDFTNGVVKCAQVTPPPPAPKLFRCHQCSWTGQTPAWHDVSTWFPGLGEFPHCPHCSGKVTFR